MSQPAAPDEQRDPAGRPTPAGARQSGNSIVPDHSSRAEEPVRPASRVAARAAARDPLAWVLGLAAFFDGISDNWVHAVLLGSVAVAVARDAARAARGVPAPTSVAMLDPDHGRHPRLRSATIAALLLGYALLAGAFQRYSWPATFAILLPASAVLLIGWRGPLRPAPVAAALHRSGARAWAAVFVAAGVWELTNLLQQPTLQVGTAEHPTISFLMDPVLAEHAGRTLTMAAWLWLGWFLITHAPGVAPGTAAGRPGETGAAPGAASAAGGPR